MSTGRPAVAHDTDPAHAEHDAMGEHDALGGLNAMSASATLHCLTGCAIGEIVGPLIGTAAGLGNGPTIAISIAPAFVFGFTLSSMPLLRAGLTVGAPLGVVVLADTFSIASMEVVDHLVMAVIPGAMNAGLVNVLFWVGMMISLTAAFAAAFPVNRFLLQRGKGHALTHEYHHGGAQPAGARRLIPAIRAPTLALPWPPSRSEGSWCRRRPIRRRHQDEPQVAHSPRRQGPSMDTILSLLLSEPAWVVYALVALVVLLEGAVPAGLLLPGEATALLGGATVAMGRTDLVPMVLVVIAAAILGDGLGFTMGRSTGPRLLRSRLLRSRRARLEELQAGMVRRGPFTLVAARWTAFVRTMMPALAGASGMSYRRFVLWNGLGAATWGATSVTLGALAGRSYEQVESWLGGGGAVVLLTVLVGAGVLTLHRHRVAAAAVRVTSAVAVPEVVLAA